jgi:SAM-dependent methyltransferase
MTALPAPLTPAGADLLADDYLALASVYDEWQERFGPFWRLALPRLLATVDRHGLPAGPPAFVDLGCGTGALLLALRRLRPGWTLTGIDASAAMLESAARKPGAAEVRWVHASFEHPWLACAAPAGARIAAAGSFFDAINHAAAPGALGRVCAATAQALAPGGLFVFDVNNRRGFEAWWQGRRFYRASGWTLTMDAAFDGRSGLAEGRAVVERRDTLQTSAVTERCFSDEEIRAALEGAGFSVEASDPWRPLPDDVPGKTWWVARRAPL